MKVETTALYAAIQIMQDVQNTCTRCLMTSELSDDQRKEMLSKLDWAKETIAKAGE